jgi:hypothetical protein
VVLDEESTGLDLVKVKGGANGPADMLEFVIDAKLLLVDLNLAWNTVSKDLPRTVEISYRCCTFRDQKPKA